MGLMILFCNLQYYCMVVLRLYSLKKISPNTSHSIHNLPHSNSCKLSDLKIRMYSLPAAGSRSQLPTDDLIDFRYRGALVH
jgi:hypothetical protein